MKLWSLDGAKIVSFHGQVVRELATVPQARQAVARLNALVAIKTAGADSDSAPTALVAALDAVLDAATDLLDANDATSLPPWAQQVMGLLVAAENTVDELMEALGVPNPDELTEAD